MTAIKFRGHQSRTDKAHEFWVRVARDYNNGMTTTEISKMYINPKTGKNYSRQYIHWVLTQVKERNINISEA